MVLRVVMTEDAELMSFIPLPFLQSVYNAVSAVGAAGAGCGIHLPGGQVDQV